MWVDGFGVVKGCVEIVVLVKYLRKCDYFTRRILKSIMIDVQDIKSINLLLAFDLFATKWADCIP